MAVDVGRKGRAIAVILSAVIAVAALVLRAQERVDFFIAAADASGAPVTDLRPDELMVMEGGRPGRIARLEPFRWPLKVTVLADNGMPAQDALVHYRNGLRRFFDALPRDVEVSFLATAPNPRWLVRPTTDRQQIARGVDLLTMDETFGRSNDAFVEFADRLELEARTAPGGRLPYRPALVSVATTGRDGSTAMRDPLLKMLNALVQHRVMASIVMLTPAVRGGRDDGTHVLVAKAVEELTGGRYEAIADSNRLTTLMPDVARQVAAVHVRQTTQYRVSMDRPEGASGPVKDLQLSISRKGVSYMVSADGSYPAPPPAR